MNEIVEVLRETSLKVDRLTTKIIREELGDDIKYFGAVVSISKFKILALVTQKAEGMDYSTLVEKTGLAKSTLSLTLNNLYDVGMITKENSKGTYIKITNFGKKFADVYDKVEKQLQSKLFDDLTKRETESFRKVLCNIKNKINTSL